MSGTVPATAADVIALVPAAATVGSPSSGTITVAATPVPPGTVITYLGLTLTSVAGARTPGSNDFDGSLGTTALIAADMLAAIQDPANAWAGFVTSSLSGSVISLTSIPLGYQTFYSMTSTDASVTLTGMAGGEVLLETMVGIAASMVSVECWGAKTCDASRALALHFLSSVQGGIPGGGGIATSIKIADISKTFAVATPTDALYGGTAWGRLYLMLYETVYCSGATGGNVCIGMVC